MYVHIHQRGDTVVAVQRSLYDRGEVADLLHEDADDDRTVVYTLLGDGQ